MLIDLSYKAIIEGLLFIAEAPVSAAELAKICEISEPDVREVLALLSEDYSREDRGIVLREVGGGWQFATRLPWRRILKKPYLKRKQSFRMPPMKHWRSSLTNSPSPAARSNTSAASNLTARFSSSLREDSSRNRDS